MTRPTLHLLVAVVVGPLLVGCALNDVPPGAPGSATVQLHGEVVTTGVVRIR